jgi:hypothetical protein
VQWEEILNLQLADDDDLNTSSETLNQKHISSEDFVKSEPLAVPCMPNGLQHSRRRSQIGLKASPWGAAPNSPPEKASRLRPGRSLNSPPEKASRLRPGRTVPRLSPGEGLKAPTGRRSLLSPRRPHSPRKKLVKTG